MKRLFAGIAAKVFRLADRLLKPLKPYYKRYRQFLRKSSYHAWALTNNDDCFVDNPQSKQPLISIVVPLFNTPRVHFLEMVYSIVNQHYPNWELILVNASDKPTPRQQAMAAADIDTRVKVIDTTNRGIAANTNVGIKAAKGEYVGFMDHDDLLHPCALHSVAECWQRGAADIIYTDEDKVDEAGSWFSAPLCKPRWSPDLFRNVNYINHFCVVKREPLNGVKGLRADFDGAQDYDLLLRLIDNGQPLIKHVPRVLYHWRAAATSTARTISTKKYIFKAGTRALREHLERNHIKASVKAVEGKPGFYKVSYPAPQKVSIVISPVEKRFQAATAYWLKDLSKKWDKLGYQLLIGNWYQAYQPQLKPSLKLIQQDDNYWGEVAERIKGSVVVCFQEAASPDKVEDISELAAVAAQDHVLAVSPIVVDKEDSIMDAGHIEGLAAQPLFVGHKYDEDTFFGPTSWVRDVEALSLNVFAAKSEDFKALAIHSKSAMLPRLQQPKQANDSQLVIWGHSKFEYKGSFRDQPAESSFNHQLLQPTTFITMKTANWENVREED